MPDTYKVHIMPTWTSREIETLLKADGWSVVAVEGSHQQWKHPMKPGRVTLATGRRDIPMGTMRSIYRQAGWDWSTRKT